MRKFLISAGYSQDQLAAMMGLLGSIAGYLLGKEGSKTDRSTDTQRAETVSESVRAAIDDRPPHPT